VDGTGAAASFFLPRGITTDASGNVYVADYWNNAIRKITAAGVVTTVAGSWVAGSADGTGAAAQFYHPHGITTDASGNLYVTDSRNHTVRKITPAGVVSTVIGSFSLMGFEDGRAMPGMLATPSGVAIYGNSIFVLDANGVAVTSPLP
jgi:streptogramin lyase